MQDSSIFYIFDWETPKELKGRFTRDFLRELTGFKRMYGLYPPITIFKGKLGKILYDIVTKYKLNFGASTEFKDHYDNEVIMKSDKNLTLEVDKSHDMGFIYTKETTIKPEYSIKIIKL